MQKPEPDAVIVDEASEMPSGVTDEQVAALLEKAKVAKAGGMRARKAKKDKPPVLANVTRNGKKTPMYGVVNVVRTPKVPAPFKWYVKKYPHIMLHGDPVNETDDQELGIRKQFGPFQTNRAMIRASTVYHDLKTSRRKRIKAQYRARLLMRQAQRMVAA